MTSHPYFDDLYFIPPYTTNLRNILGWFTTALTSYCFTSCIGKDHSPWTGNPFLNQPVWKWVCLEARGLNSPDSWLTLVYSIWVPLRYTWWSSGKKEVSSRQTEGKGEHIGFLVKNQGRGKRLKTWLMVKHPWHRLNTYARRMQVCNESAGGVPSKTSNKMISRETEWVLKKRSWIDFSSVYPLFSMRRLLLIGLSNYQLIHLDPSGAAWGCQTRWQTFFVG